MIKINATPKAVKAASNLAKTVSIDEINKKLDEASSLQTTGNSTTDLISQKALTETVNNIKLPVLLIAFLIQSKGLLLKK
ncbi:hypothetical protein [Candidatus Williamhamiltonella defendens]|uniref:hypothetical protein n=1 Tax=Candidatus Williamhamiltonella defendens TaxID=138072 RepID=UPI00130E642C|nr:hypothetical protein [Candidatus Hamiltonella defensa]